LISLKRKILLALGVGLCLTIFGIMAPNEAYATDNQEQVVVSPAQQAVDTALATATTEVQQAIAATDTATATIAVAVDEKVEAQAAVDTLTATVSVAQSTIALVDTATATINAIDLSVTPVDQSSQLVQDAKNTITTAQTSINNIDTSTVQVQVSEAIAARTLAVTARTTAQTELTQANIAIDNAQTAVNNLQATIGTSTNVLAGVDDAGVKMNLPFGMQMGETLYNNVFVGSNATITFGVNEGGIYHTTPNAPSVSIAGWDWTTWSTGTGITYATTGTSLDIAWDLRPYPQQDASTQMVQVRFNADVNPNDGAWIANVTANGPIPNGARFNYRETTNGAVTEITNTNTGIGFAGQISQGEEFTPYVDPNTSTIQAAVDSANVTIAQLNASLTPVVAQNTTNTSAINAINTTSLTNAVNSAVSSKTNLQTQLDTNAQELITAISTNIPTPAPVISETVVQGTTVTIAPELPTGYAANTWFYQVETEDPNAENPYEGGTYNTSGAPESIELTGLTQGATYSIRVANWSGPVSEYAEVVVSIPATQNANLNGGGAIQPPPAPEPPVEQPSDPAPMPVPPAEEPPAVEIEPPVVVEEPPIVIEEPPVVIEEPPIVIEEPPVVVEEPPAVEPEPPVIQELPPLTVEEILSVVEDLVADGNLTAADAEAVLDALMSDGEITSSEISTLTDNLISDGTLTANESDLVLDALNSDGVVTNSEVTSLVEALVSEGGLSANEAALVVDALSADGDITTSEVNNLSDALTQDGSFTLAEKDLVSDVLITAADGAPVTAANIESAGLEYRDLPPLIPVEVREDANGNPVVINAEVASALLVLENPAALLDAVATCFNPDEAIEGLTEEQKCELGKALLSIGADMSIPEREKAEDIVVVTIIAGQIIVAAAPRRRR
jgi:polyhydroxyalkanoate synthesis regulator phasin